MTALVNFDYFSDGTHKFDITVNERVNNSVTALVIYAISVKELANNSVTALINYHENAALTQFLCCF